MEIKSLSETNFDDIMRCFLKAFENYYVEMPTDHSYYKERWRIANVRYDLSYGMFDKGRLVGCIINAIDKRGNVLTAFNTGTGVIPEYRGQHIVRSIYEFSIPKLKENGISHCTLEVIKDNSIAIKAYEGIGFTISKDYKCFKGHITLDHSLDYELRELEASSFNWNAIDQHYYSWDHHKNAILNGNYNYYQVIKDSIIESYFIINPQNGYVLQFDVLHDILTNWLCLFSAIKSISKAVKINNVDVRLNSKIEYLNYFGLENTVDQYEMERKL